MQIEQISVESLIPYARNARTHSEPQVAQIAASIKEFGFCNPVLVDDNDGIIAGHGRVLAARKLNIEQVPCVRLSHLTEIQRRAYIITDNKLALNSGWDDEMLALEMAELQLADFDVSLTGFDTAEIATLDFKHGSEADQGILDELAPNLVKCPFCSNEFDSRAQV